MTAVQQLWLSTALVDEAGGANALRMTDADMIYAAVYQADWPGATALGDVDAGWAAGLNSAGGGASIGGGLNPSFTSTGSAVRSSGDVGVFADPKYCELLVLSANPWTAFGVIHSTPYDLSQFFGGPAREADSAYYRTDGAWHGYGSHSGVGPALSPGDILGMVVRVGLFNEYHAYYINGVQVAEVHSPAVASLTLCVSRE